MTSALSLPVYVEPASGEALISWLSRLAARLGVSLPVLIEHALSIEIPTTEPGWWRRLHPWQINRMAQIVGLSVSRLREMTFIDWKPLYRNDEAPERFSAARWKARYRDQSTRHFAVCPQCVTEDAQAYLRLEWTLGWIAVCPRHVVVLITRCPHCRAKLRIPPPRSTRTIPTLRCNECHQPFSSARRVPAHPRVVQLQAALIAAKRAGRCKLALLESMSWSQLLVLADSLLKVFWVAISPRDRGHLLSWIQYDLCLPLSKNPGRWRERYESLAILTWLLEVPRYNPGVFLTGDNLSHWLAHHARPVFDSEGRAMLLRDAMPSALKGRLTDLISMVSPFRFTGQVAMRAGFSVRHPGRASHGMTKIPGLRNRSTN